MTPEELAETKRANDLKEREVRALERLAASQATLAGLVAIKAKEGTSWQKFWYGGNGGAGARSRHMRMNY